MLLNMEERSLEEKIGSLFIASCNKNEIDGEIIQLITTYHIGGVLLQMDGWKKENKLAHFTRYLQYYAGNNDPIFIATNRQNIEQDVLTNITKLPTHNELGRLNNRLYTKQISEIIAKEQRTLGINLIFSPNLESLPQNENCFSGDFDVVAKHSIAMIQGFTKGNVATVVTGALREYTENDRFKPDSKRSDFYPFYKVIKEGADVLFVHELNQTLIDQTIRGTLAFDGIIAYSVPSSITTIEEIAQHIVYAIELGIGMIILPFSYRKQITILNRLNELAKQGKIDESKLDVAFEKSYEIKKCFAMNQVESFQLEKMQTNHAKHLKTKIADKLAVN